MHSLAVSWIGAQSFLKRIDGLLGTAISQQIERSIIVIFGLLAGSFVGHADPHLEFISILAFGYLGLTCSVRRYTFFSFVIKMETHALHLTFHLERHPRTPARALAQPVPAVAHGDLLRREDAADPLHRVLGLYVARALEPVAISEVVGGNGTLRAAQGEGFIGKV